MSSTAHAEKLAIAGGQPVSSEPIPVVAVRLADEDVEAAIAVLRSGMLAQGRNVLALEAAFADQTGAKHAIACANGTCALQLAYEPLIQPGEDVLVCAWGYIATASMIVARGANPVFVDADPIHFTIDLEDAARRVTDKTTALATTHLYGSPADIEAVQRFAGQHGLKVIYDAAQAHLATHAGEGLGAFGDAATYSFYPTKNMTTGEGGMITTNDDDLAHKMRLLRSHGETQKYVHEIVGYNYRMTDVEAAIGLSQLQRLPEPTERRRNNAAALDAVLAEIEGIASPQTPTSEDRHVYHLYAAKLDLEQFSCTRDEFCDALRAEGVHTAIHYPRPITRQPLFKDADGDFPVAGSLATSLFCLPVHPFLEERQLHLIGAALRKVASACRR